MVGTRGRLPKAKTLIAFSAMIMLLFCVFVAYQASKAYERSIEEGKANAVRLTQILSDQVELSLLAVDLTLRRAVERQYFNTMFGGNLPHDIENNFRLWVEETPQIVALMLVNEKGTIEVAANKPGYDDWYDYDNSVADEAAFRAMIDDGGPGFFVGQQRTRIPEHPKLMVMSRRINKLDGSFGGVIIAAIDPRIFIDFFTSVDTAATHRFMALMLSSGEVLYTGPDDSAGRDTILDYIGEEAVKSKQPRLVTADTRTFDGAVTVYAYMALKNVPIITSIIIDEKDFLGDWRKARVKDISFLAIFTIFGSVLSYFALNMAKQIVRVEESEAAAILASQAKSEFLANMSHELRTPLNAVIGFSEMLSAGYFGPLNDKQRERVQDINLCGTHLLQLISDILEFSKGEAGKLELNEEELDIHRAVEEATRIVAERAKAKHITLATEITPNLGLLLADKRKIRQILLNLLSNAIKFTPQHGKVTVSARIDNHGQLVLSVTDTGIGIAENDISTALAVFGQVHRNHSHEGTGLGLPLCKMFAELHGGKLQLTSEVGVGTTVRIIFPDNRVVRE
ncbi:sensor histidine kinase [Methylocystis sp.]|uniref:sensor histidine kinase n=1 Tax=Methylocystis sp. TaxID=1911079 RepID=UPI003DA269BF